MHLFPLFDIIKAVVELVERLHPPAAPEGQLSVIPELQKEAFGQLLDRLLERAEELPVGEVLRLRALLKAAQDQRFRLHG